MQKTLFVVLLGVLYLFNYQYHYGRGGYGDDIKVKDNIIKQAKLNDQLEDRNSLMQIKLSGLKGSPDFLEARARMELGVIKPDETLIMLPDELAAANN